MDRFPLALFPPTSHKPWIAGSALSGGQPIAGAPQTADLSGGGWWQYSFSVGILRSHAQHGAWRALVAELNAGVCLIEVPVLDALQPFPGGARPARVRFADRSDFSDTSEFDTEPITAALAADVYMPASPAPPSPPTQAQIQLTIGSPLQGGEYFSIIGPSGNVRMHMVTRILAVAGDVYTVKLRPAFREDMAEGTAVDFNLPRFTAKAELASIKDAWPTLTVPFVGRPSITFVESGFVVPPEG